jgi:hypothetical protein
VIEYIAATTLVLHALTLCVWLKKLVRQNIPNWLWITGWSSILISGGLSILEIIHYENNKLRASGALVLSAALFCGATRVHAVLRQQAKEKAYYAHLQSAFSTLITDRGQLAEKLAVLLTDLHEKIAHYESQAQEHGLPLYVSDQERAP